MAGYRSSLVGQTITPRRPGAVSTRRADAARKSIEPRATIAAWGRPHRRRTPPHASRIAIGGYLDGGTAFDEALVEFGERYADRTDRDHRALADAVRSGRIEARSGV